MPKEKIGDNVEVFTADHPERTDSPEYLKSRKWLMGQAAGGCCICGGPVDLSHPEAPGNAKGFEDHHGGGLYVGQVLVGFNLFPMEWSMGFGANPQKIAAYIKQLADAKLVKYDKDIKTTEDVMAWVDSQMNANVKLCRAHHIGHQSQHTPDANGHEAVGIHNIPFPIFAAQATCDWERFDMWAGTTGTVAVSPDPDKTNKGGVVVHYVHDSHPVKLTVGQKLPLTHPHSRTAHAGYRKAQAAHS